MPASKLNTGDLSAEQLLDAIADVLKRSGLTDGHVPQRRFDDAARQLRARLPLARQLQLRLGFAHWKDLVAVCQQQAGQPAIAEAAKIVDRAGENHVADERHVALCMSRVAGELGVKTLSPVRYDAGRQTLLDRARHDGTFQFWSQTLLTAGQIDSVCLRIDADWDTMLVVAGLQARRGKSIEDAGAERVTAIRKRLGLDREKTPGVDRQAKRTTKEMVGDRSRPKGEPTVKAEETPAPAVSAGPKSSGRAQGAARKTIDPAELVRAYARQQGAYPATRATLDEWAATYDILTPRLGGIVWDDLLDRAHTELAAAGHTLDRQDLRLARQTDFSLPRPQGMPRRAAKRISEAAAKLALEEFLGAPRKSKKTTTREYMAWAIDNEKPSFSSIQRAATAAKWKGGWKDWIADARKRIERTKQPSTSKSAA